MDQSPIAILIATMDTKGREAEFVAQCLKNEKITVKIIDAGIKGKKSG